MAGTRDYPLAGVLGAGNLIHHARPAGLLGKRIETRCGLEGDKTDRDGGIWCPDCLALERAKTGTHDERDGDGDPYDWDPVYAATAIDRLQKALAAETATCKRWLQRTVELGKRAGNAEATCEDLREQLAAATARAESATVLHERWKALRVERDAANKRAEKAEARLAKLHADIKVADGVRALAQRQRRELDAVIQQHLDALMVENCELRTRVEAPDAAPDGLSEPVERSETSGGIGTASNSSTGTAGLSERCPCGCPKIGDGCNCRYCNEPYPTRQPNDDTTEDGQHG